MGDWQRLLEVRTSYSYVSRYVHHTYAIRYDQREDEHSTETFDNCTLRSLSETREYICANVLHKADVMTGGDGEPLCSQKHPVIGGVKSPLLQSNILKSVACRSAFMQMCDMIAAARDYRGKLNAKLLIVPPSLKLWAHEVTQLTSFPIGLQDAGHFPTQYIVMHRMEDKGQWFIKTDCPFGLRYYERSDIQLRDLSPTSKAGSFRGSAGWTDWRGIYGSFPQ